MRFRNVLVHADNLEVMKQLFSSTRKEPFDLIYLDPPFFTQRTHRLQSATVNRNQIGFEDVWRTKTDLDYLQKISVEDERLRKILAVLQETMLFSAETGFLAHIAIRILYCQKLLKATGSLFLHCDPRMSHYIKIICDSVFGKKCFRNEIIWRYHTGGSGKHSFANKHDVIFWYSKEPTGYKFYPSRIPESRTAKSLLRAKNARGARINIEDINKNPSDVWEIPALNPMSNERTGYPTQKPQQLIERILLACTSSGDNVADFYCGSGTTCKAASELGRNWFGVDRSETAIEISSQRMGMVKGSILSL